MESEADRVSSAIVLEIVLSKMFENKLFSFSDLSVEKKIWPAGLFFTHTPPPPLGQDVAEFRAGEKGILSGQRSFFLAL